MDVEWDWKKWSGGLVRLAIAVATMSNDHEYPGHIPTWQARSSNFSHVYVIRNHEENLGVIGSYQHVYEQSEGEDVLAYLHDDVICKEHGWDSRVLKEFEDERVAIVGFGGATRHGTRDLYKVPYYLPNLRRDGYCSNVDDAEVHGERFSGARDVAVLDGFALIVRRSFLDRINGWTDIAKGCDFYCYDYALCALARRYGYCVRVVGVRCHHLGGVSSTKAEAQKITGQEVYEKSHRWFYEEFRDVMPHEVGNERRNGNG